MPNYPDDVDPSLWPTRHLSEREVLNATSYGPGPSPTDTALWDEIEKLHRRISYLNHINGMLNDQLRRSREAAHEQSMPAEPKRKPGRRGWVGA